MGTEPDSHDGAAREAWALMFDILIGSNFDRTSALARRGLTPNDSRALYSLKPGPGQPIGALARQWQCDPSTATWIVDRLERAGLAERRPSPDDRRVKLVARTPRGEAVMRELMAEFLVPPPALRQLSIDELHELARLLRKMV